MRKRMVACLLMGALMVTFVAGCVPANHGTERGSDNPISIVQVEAMPLIAPSFGERDLSVMTAADGANDFAFRLSAALAQSVGDESFVVSPYSVWLPLAALLNATDESHSDALLAALSASGISVADLNRAASRMLYDLTNERDREFAEEYGFEHHNPLRIANAIFVGKDVTLRRDFAQIFMDYYRGTAINADFLSPDAVCAVNAWASEHTDGLITDLIQEFDPLTVAVIANAIYFSDRWREEFNPDETTEGVFYAPTGEQSAYFMLREGDDQLYYEDDLVQAIQLPFVTGGGMTILLPKSGDAVELLSNMTHAYFEEIQRGFSMHRGRLLLPRFSIESTIDNLGDILTALGVPLFDETSAPLTNGLIYEYMPVWLSGAIQKAMIEVDERGTTAAAVTMFPTVGSAPPPPEPFEMICDRPFVFVLHRRTVDGGSQVLFTGVVNQP